MPDVVAALRAQQDELAALVRDASAERLDAASRCPGWSVADVLLHLAQSNEAAVASVHGTLAEERWSPPADPDATVDDVAADMVEAERGDPEASRDRWLASADAQAQAFDGCDPHAQVQWVVGLLAARTLATTRLTECWIHTGDVAEAYGAAPAATDRLWHTCRLVERTVPYAFERGGHDAAGAVAFEVGSPSGARWAFGDVAAAPTVVRGSALALCEVAGQRATAAEVGLEAEGPDAEAALALVRTFA